MFTRRSTILFSVALVAVSVLAVRSFPLLFARGAECGELCNPGEVKEEKSDAIVTPNPATFPPSFEVSWTERIIMTDGSCQEDDLPPECGCEQWDSDPKTDPKTVSFDKSQTFARQADGNYKPEQIVTCPLKMGGDTYVKCSDDYGNTW